MMAMKLKEVVGRKQQLKAQFAQEAIIYLKRKLAGGDVFFKYRRWLLDPTQPHLDYNFDEIVDYDFYETVLRYFVV